MMRCHKLCLLSNYRVYSTSTRGLGGEDVA